MEKKVDMFESFVELTDAFNELKVYLDIGASHRIQSIYINEGGNTILAFGAEEEWEVLESPEEVIKRVNKVMQKLYEKVKKEAEQQKLEAEEAEKKKREDLEKYYENLRKSQQ